MEDNYKIYSLRSPESDNVRYIGYTKKSLEKRLKGHLGDSYNSYKVNWIKGLKANNLIPIIELIEDGISEDDVKQKEIHYIKLFKSFGAKLVNGTLGGDGVKPTKETTEKIASKNRGRKMPEHVKQKLIEANKGRAPWNKGTKGVVVSWNKGLTGFKWNRKYKGHSEETRKKIGESGKGRIPWNKGKKGQYKTKGHSEETKAKISKANKGNMSEEGKRKLSELRKKDWAEGKLAMVNKKQAEAKAKKDAFGANFAGQVAESDGK